jgi:hypothetical protein
VIYNNTPPDIEVVIRRSDEILQYQKLMDLAKTKMKERFEHYVSDEIDYHFSGDNSYLLDVVLKKGKNQHQVCS